MDVRRGDIWYADLPHVGGSVQSGRRPCIIVSNDVANIMSPVITIVPLTAEDKKEMPTHFKIYYDYMREESTVLGEQLMCINRTCLLSKVGELSYRGMMSVEEVIKVGLNIK